MAFGLKSQDAKPRQRRTSATPAPVAKRRLPIEMVELGWEMEQVAKGIDDLATPVDSRDRVAG